MTSRFVRLSRVPQANVLELLLPDSIEPDEFDQLNESLAAMVDEHPGEAWVVDLGAVKYLGSAMLGLLVNVRHRVRASGGQLVLCALSPRLLEIFHASSLERMFPMAKNRVGALGKFAS